MYKKFLTKNISVYVAQNLCYAKFNHKTSNIAAPKQTDTDKD